ncbi:hypothetical protein M0G43_14830 [Subsaxibacter sp. CAU 1640]|uniref:hypothetical protein n=1 Tax=Subsaxibacter sp. CAU 1640 TaxID=2933271 RepID=UPI0020047E5A|nr:hypothetical protein [Subsaxibacter sp. CAU 1640]MCK7591859.1 hypothetical protein [Subsaxibacter sp. CAU 1640]
MIISLHTPKSGGGSFREMLQKEYGKSFLGDYKDIPINKTYNDRINEAVRFDKKLTFLKRFSYNVKRIECIHGHFLPYKYRKFKNNPKTIFVTWLRDPAERLISHYHYWFRTYNKNSAALHKRVVEESWSLEKFCLSTEMQNFYGKFLWEFPIENFDFVGITEHYEDDVIYFANRFMNKVMLKNDIPMKNVNPNNKNSYSHNIPSDLLLKITDFHSSDFDIYQKALDARTARIEKQL